MQIRRKILVCIVLMASLSATVFAQERIRVAVYPDFPPFSWIEDGNPKGLIPDLISQIGRTLGLSVEFTPMELSMADNAIHNGDVMLAVHRREPGSGEPSVAIPLISGWSQIIALPTEIPESSADLNSQLIGIVKGDPGYAGLEQLATEYPEMRIIPFHGYNDLLSALSTGEIRYGLVPAYLPLPEGSELQRSTVMLPADPLVMSFSLQLDRQIQQSIRDLVQVWIQKADSPYYRILDRYLPRETQVEYPLWLIIILIILIFLLVVSVLNLRYTTQEKAHALKKLEEANATLVEKVGERSIQLDESRRLLEQSERMAGLGRMVAGVAHEVNTPLGIALTATTFLTDHVQGLQQAYDGDALTEEKFQNFIESSVSTGSIIVTNLKRAADLIQSFKEISIDQNIESLRVINLKLYSEQLMKSLFPQIKHTPHSYHLEAEDVTVLTYPGYLAQIITNLFENALVHAFTDDMKGFIEIGLVFDDKHNSIILEVADNGRGIRSDIIDQMYEPFVSSKRFEGSSGLGLSIVNNLVVDKFHGNIIHQTTAERGTVFFITLPATPADPG